jgi:hypothetical protein
MQIAIEIICNNGTPQETIADCLQNLAEDIAEYGLEDKQFEDNTGIDGQIRAEDI